MSDSEPDQDPWQRGDEPAVEPPGPAETTDPLPVVQAEEPSPPESTINQPTTALPLLDLLAPQPQPGFPAGTPQSGAPDQAPGSAQPYSDQLYSAPLLAGQQHSDQLLSGQQYSNQLFSGGTQAGPVHGDPFGAPGATMVGRVAPPPAARRPGLHGWPLVAGIAGCVVLLGLIGWLAIGSLPGGDQRTTTTSAVPTTSAVMVANGFQFTQASARADADCASNAYGEVADFFRDTPCSSLRRMLLTTSAEGRPVVVSVSTVTMPDERSAAALKKLADTNGTGNVSDLLRAGVRVPSAPESFTNASYASSHDGDIVVIVEVDYVDPAQRSDATLDKVAVAAIELGQGSG